MTKVYDFEKGNLYWENSRAESVPTVYLIANGICACYYNMTPSMIEKYWDMIPKHWSSFAVLFIQKICSISAAMGTLKMVLNQRPERSTFNKSTFRPFNN